MERTRSLVPQVSGSLPLQALSTKVNIRSEAPRPAERRVRDGWSARGFRESEVLHLALMDEVFHGSGDVFDRHVGIYAVLIEQVDDIGLEALKRCLGDLLDVFWTTVLGSPTRVQGRSTIGIRLATELGCDHHLVTKWGQRFAHERFVFEGTIAFGGVEKCDATFDSRPDQRDHFLLVACRTVANAHSHTAESDRRYFQIAFSKVAFLHRFSFGVFLSSTD